MSPSFGLLSKHQPAMIKLPQRMRKALFLDSQFAVMDRECPGQAHYIESTARVSRTRPTRIWWCFLNWRDACISDVVQ